MKQYCLKISSKNEKSLNSFLQFFSKHSKTKFNIIKKSIAKKRQKRIFAILKSPHVNKTAQEQFEYRIFSKQLQVKSSYFTRNLIFLKKITNRLFQDVSVNLELFSGPTIAKKNQLLTLYPENFKLGNEKTLLTNLKRKKQKKLSKNLPLKKKYLFNLNKFIKTFDIFGEILITQNNK